MLNVTLSTGKRRHLVSAYATVSHLLLQMEEAARDGRSPTGVGPPLTPLSPEQAEPVLAPLRALKEQLREVAQELAPAELAELQQPQSRSNSLVWLSNLLDHIRIAVDGLEPRRVRKYGELSPDEAVMFGAIHGDLFQEIQNSRASLDAQMQTSPEKADADAKRR